MTTDGERAGESMCVMSMILQCDWCNARGGPRRPFYPTRSGQAACDHCAFKLELLYRKEWRRYVIRHPLRAVFVTFVQAWRRSTTSFR